MNEIPNLNRTTPLRCACGSTFAHIRDDGALVIVSRHHGQKCTNVITLEELQKLQREVELKS